jgi:hypothetical protein
VPETVYSRCDALGASDWTAGVERRADRGGKQRRVIVVRGKVTVPSTDHEVSLDRGSLGRIAPRTLQVLVRTTRSGDAGAQAMTTRDIQGAFAWDERVEAIEVRCGDGIIAQVPRIAVEPAA